MTIKEAFDVWREAVRGLPHGSDFDEAACLLHFITDLIDSGEVRGQWFRDHCRHWKADTLVIDGALVPRERIIDAMLDAPPKEEGK